MKRYIDCNVDGVTCDECSLSSYGRDCHNKPANPLAYLRTKKGMTVQQLADAIGMSRGNICDIEKGRRQIGNLTLNTAIKLADALEIDDLRRLLL